MPVETGQQGEAREFCNVIIHLPNGGFKCLALPLEALEEDENE
jgi:hypothetical protein